MTGSLADGRTIRHPRRQISQLIGFSSTEHMTKKAKIEEWHFYCCFLENVCDVTLLQSILVLCDGNLRQSLSEIFDFNYSQNLSGSHGSTKKRASKKVHCSIASAAQIGKHIERFRWSKSNTSEKAERQNSKCFCRKSTVSAIPLCALQVFKIIKGIDDIGKHTYFDLVEADPNKTLTRQNADRLNIKREKFNTEIGRHRFSTRVSGLWNKIPAFIKDSRDVNQFKNRYDVHMRE